MGSLRLNLAESTSETQLECLGNCKQTESLSSSSSSIRLTELDHLIRKTEDELSQLQHGFDNIAHLTARFNQGNAIPVATEQNYLNSQENSVNLSARSTSNVCLRTIAEVAESCSTGVGKVTDETTKCCLVHLDDNSNLINDAKNLSIKEANRNECIPHTANKETITDMITVKVDQSVETDYYNVLKATKATMVDLIDITNPGAKVMNIVLSMSDMQIFEFVPNGSNQARLSVEKVTDNFSLKTKEVSKKVKVMNTKPRLSVQVLPRLNIKGSLTVQNLPHVVICPRVPYSADPESQTKNVIYVELIHDSVGPNVPSKIESQISKSFEIESNLVSNIHEQRQDLDGYVLKTKLNQVNTTAGVKLNATEDNTFCLPNRHSESVRVTNLVKRKLRNTILDEIDKQFDSNEDKVVTIEWSSENFPYLKLNSKCIKNDSVICGSKEIDVQCAVKNTDASTSVGILEPIPFLPRHPQDSCATLNKRNLVIDPGSLYFHSVQCMQDPVTNSRNIENRNESCFVAEDRKCCSRKKLLDLVSIPAEPNGISEARKSVLEMLEPTTPPNTPSEMSGGLLLNASVDVNRETSNLSFSSTSLVILDKGNTNSSRTVLSVSPTPSNSLEQIPLREHCADSTSSVLARREFSADVEIFELLENQLQSKSSNTDTYCGSQPSTKTTKVSPNSDSSEELQSDLKNYGGICLKNCKETGATDPILNRNSKNDTGHASGIQLDMLCNKHEQGVHHRKNGQYTESVDDTGQANQPRNLSICSFINGATTTPLKTESKDESSNIKYIDDLKSTFTIPTQISPRRVSNLSDKHSAETQTYAEEEPKPSKLSQENESCQTCFCDHKLYAEGPNMTNPTSLSVDPVFNLHLHTSVLEHNVKKNEALKRIVVTQSAGSSSGDSQKSLSYSEGEVRLVHESSASSGEVRLNGNGEDGQKNSGTSRNRETERMLRLDFGDPGLRVRREQRYNDNWYSYYVTRSPRKLLHMREHSSSSSSSSQCNPKLL